MRESGCLARRKEEDSCNLPAKPIQANGPTIQRWGKASTFGPTKIDTLDVSHLTNCKAKENMPGIVVSQSKDTGGATKLMERPNS